MEKAIKMLAMCILASCVLISAAIVFKSINDTRYDRYFFVKTQDSNPVIFDKQTHKYYTTVYINNIPTFYEVEIYDKWEKWLKHNGYKPWQYQYSRDSPEGFQVRFWKSGVQDVELVTYSEEVKKRIMKYDAGL
jgi:hypothetical protein